MCAKWGSQEVWGAEVILWLVASILQTHRLTLDSYTSLRWPCPCAEGLLSSPSLFSSQPLSLFCLLLSTTPKFSFIDDFGYFASLSPLSVL